PETFLALCDPQPANSFTGDDLYKPLHAPGAAADPATDDPVEPRTIYWRMLQLRTPGLLRGDGPGPEDRPFLSLASGYSRGDGQYPAPHGLGIEDTLLRSFAGGARRLFQPPEPADPEAPGAHPYLANQLLTKIFDHVTTRSNVFAVWLTVGFF